MYETPQPKHFQVNSFYRMDYSDLNPSVCLVFSFCSRDEFRHFCARVRKIQSATLGHLDRDLEGPLITFKPRRRRGSRMQVCGSDEDSSSVGDTPDKGQIKVINLEELYWGHSEGTCEAEQPCEAEQSDANEFEVFESGETNQGSDCPAKSLGPEEHSHSAKRLLRKNSGFSQMSWSEMKLFGNSRKASESLSREQMPGATKARFSQEHTAQAISAIGPGERPQKVISVPAKLFEKLESVETPESSSRADNSITEVDSIKEICRTVMSTQNSQLDFIAEESDSRHGDWLGPRTRLNSGQFEKIGRDSDCSGLYSTQSNNTESFRKNSESNGLESLEGSKPRKKSKHSGLDGDSLLEDDWHKLGNMQSSGNYNTANSNGDLEPPRRMKHDFSKRTLAEQKRRWEEPLTRAPGHRQQNSLTRDSAVLLGTSGGKAEGSSRRHSSNNELLMTEALTLTRAPLPPARILKTNSSEFFAPQFSESEPPELLPSDADLAQGFKRVDSFTKISFCQLKKCRLCFAALDEDDSHEHRPQEAPSLETPPLSAERKKRARKLLEEVPA